MIENTSGNCEFENALQDFIELDENGALTKESEFLLRLVLVSITARVIRLFRGELEKMKEKKENDD